MIHLLISITYFFLSFISPTRDILAIEINGIKSDQGNIVIGVYNNKDSFPKYTEVFIGQIIPAQKGKVTAVFNNLPDGEYAIAIWHDENNNKKLDTNWVGIPNEQYGFSNNIFGKFGPPSFEETAFQVEKNRSQKLTISLK